MIGIFPRNDRQATPEAAPHRTHATRLCKVTLQLTPLKGGLSARVWTINLDATCRHAISGLPRKLAGLRKGKTARTVHIREIANCSPRH